MNNEDIQQALTKVCRSAVLEKSPQNVKIMEFLVDQALKGEFVKEFSLGIAIFGERYKPEESTSKVRVAMYKFRKKLEQYYLEEGKDDSIVFVVKKGQYNLEFIHQHNLKERKYRAKPLQLIGAVVSFIAIAMLLFCTHKKPETFWDYYFATNSNNLCFVSDQFVVSEQLPKDDYQFITSTHINSEEDFLNAPKYQNNTHTKVANFTYTSQMAPIAINDLAPWFTINKSKMTVRLESEFQFNDVADHNLIFLGHYRQYQNAKTLFLSNSKVFKAQKNGFMYYQGSDSVHYKNSFVDMERIDYTMVSFMNLDNDKKALFIASNNDIGVIALSRKLSDREQLKEFYTHIPDTATYFNALFKVYGMKRTDMGCDLLHIELFP